MNHNVFIYVLDSLRPDFVGSYNPAVDHTPHLDAFARDSTRFARAYTQDTWSKPAATALITGHYGGALGMIQKQRALGPQIPTLAARLAARGYQTAAISGNIFFSGIYGLDRGFDAFTLLHHRHRHETEATPTPTVTGRQINSQVFTQIDTAEEPLFMVVWNMDPHGPYYDRRLAEAGKPFTLITYDELAAAQSTVPINTLYGDMVSYADTRFGDFIAHLKQKNLYDDALIIVLSDHGESLGEQQTFGHAGLPLLEQIHIALWIKLPGQAAAGAVRDQLVELVDVPATILDLLNMPAQGNGRSLLPLIHDPTQPGRRWVYAEGQEHVHSNRYASILTEQWHYLYLRNMAADLSGLPHRLAHRIGFGAGHRHWLYDLDDPQRTRYGIEKMPRIARPWQSLDRRFILACLRLQQRTRQNARFFARHVRTFQDIEVTDTIRQRLIDLGYGD